MFENSQTIITLYGLPNIVKSFEQQFKTINDSIRHQQTLKYKVEFQIDEPGFEVFLQSNHQQLLDIVNSKCSLNHLILRQHIQIQIPQAKVQKLEDNNQSENTPTDPEINRTSNWLLDLFSWGTPKTKTEPPKPSTTSRSIPIGKSKIIVCIGDLTQQTV